MKPDPRPKLKFGAVCVWLYKTEPLMPLLQYSEWNLLNVMSYHDSDSCLWNILNFSCLFFAASLIHNQEPCIFKWFLICEESVLSLPVFFYVDIASLFKNQGKWHRSLCKHWKELDKEASLTRGGVVLGTVSMWLLMFGPRSSMSLWILLFCFLLHFYEHLT